MPMDLAVCKLAASQKPVGNSTGNSLGTRCKGTAQGGFGNYNTLQKSTPAKN
jgi:hypothetical protein